MLTDYLRADDNAYIRAVISKMMVATAVRVYEPGVMFDAVCMVEQITGIGTDRRIPLSIKVRGI
jgi:predicted P-loop ATPase